MNDKNLIAGDSNFVGPYGTLANHKLDRIKISSASG